MTDEREKEIRDAATLFETFATNGPETNESGQFDLSAFMDVVALNVGRLLAQAAVPERANNESMFMNGALFGIMLSELGRGRFLLREKSGKPTPKAKAEDEQQPIAMPDLSQAVVVPGGEI